MNALDFRVTGLKLPPIFPTCPLISRNHFTGLESLKSSFDKTNALKREKIVIAESSSLKVLCSGNISKGVRLNKEVYRLSDAKESKLHNTVSLVAKVCTL